MALLQLKKPSRKPNGCRIQETLRKFCCSSENLSGLLWEVSSMIIQYNPKSILLAVCLLLCHVKIALAYSVPHPLDEQQTMQVLFANFHVELPSTQKCAAVEGATVGEFVATTLAYLAQEQGRGIMSQVEYERIELNDGTKKDIIELYSEGMGFPASVHGILSNVAEGSVLHQYTIWWNYAEGENNWSRGIQFLVYGAEGLPIEGTFRCLLIP
jgi:hypothetical protein